MNTLTYLLTYIAVTLGLQTTFLSVGHTQTHSFDILQGGAKKWNISFSFVISSHTYAKLM